MREVIELGACRDGSAQRAPGRRCMGWPGAWRAGMGRESGPSRQGDGQARLGVVGRGGEGALHGGQVLKGASARSVWCHWASREPGAPAAALARMRELGGPAGSGPRGGEENRWQRDGWQGWHSMICRTSFRLCWPVWPCYWERWQAAPRRWIPRPPQPCLRPSAPRLPPCSPKQARMAQPARPPRRMPPRPRRSGNRTSPRRPSGRATSCGLEATPRTAAPQPAASPRACPMHVAAAAS
jgi:hypothetical protein